MTTQTSLESSINKLFDFPVKLVCPSCGLDQLVVDKASTNSGVVCQACDAHFEIENNFPSLVVGERFLDESDEECLCYEEDSNDYTTRHYWIPLFKSELKSVENPILLAVGCGIGREVDMLCDAGLDCIGIDNGNRSKIWPRRKHKNRFLMANGMHLPFPDDSFDVVFCGCVFPHVGVKGDSVEVSASYLEDRSMLAQEMARVLRPGGQIVAASPNRHFPFDIFHGREKGSYLPRFNRPSERFLMTFKDYRTAFKSELIKSAELLPVEGYWGFVRSKSNLKGLILGLPVRFVFWLLSTKAFKFLRGSFIAPWIIVRLKKVPTN